MPHVAFLIAASPTPAFYSQIAVLHCAINKLPWSRWEPSLHVYIGGQRDAGAYEKWRRHLGTVEFTWASSQHFAEDGDWAQSDDVFRFAPRDADVLLAIDADTLPVKSLEEVLDRVVEKEAIAGVVAHYPTVLGHTWDNNTMSFSVQPSDTRFPETSSRAAWERMSRGLIDSPLAYDFFHTLMTSAAPAEQREAPFYLNFGAVFFPDAVFDPVASRYLAFRPRLMERLPFPEFSGQAALTLAVAAAGINTWALPMRYNFPNDPIAEVLYPEELAQVVVFHYLRTTRFDRHRIFTNSEEYSKFLALPLTGSELSFQQSVTSILGVDYPFA